SDLHEGLIALEAGFKMLWRRCHQPHTAALGASRLILLTDFLDLLPTAGRQGAQKAHFQFWSGFGGFAIEVDAIWKRDLGGPVGHCKVWQFLPGDEIALGHLL